MIDLVLAGDNAIVVGSLAAGLPRDQQKKVVLVGIGAALVLRIGFSLIASQLLQVVGLMLAGGLLLLWVAWKMWRELRRPPPGSSGDAAVEPARTLAQAAWAVALADVSMSLDNVLGVAGAAHEYPAVMVFGLVLSVALMGVASSIIARYIERYRLIAWAGLAVIVYVAGKMVWEGAHDLHPVVAGLAV